MAIKNTKLGGTDFVTLYEADFVDFNDTNNAIIDEYRHRLTLTAGEDLVVNDGIVAGGDPADLDSGKLYYKYKSPYYNGNYKTQDSFNNSFGASNEKLDTVKLSDTLFICAYQGTSDYAYLGAHTWTEATETLVHGTELSGGSINVNAGLKLVRLSDTSFATIKRTAGSSTLYINRYTVSGTTITASSSTTITGVDSAISKNLIGMQLDTEKMVVVYADVSAVQAKVFTWSATWSAGSAYQINTASVTAGEIFNGTEIGTDKVVACYQTSVTRYANILTISGTVITPGTEVTTSSDDLGTGVLALNSNTLALTISRSTVILKVKIYDVSGTTLVGITDLQVTQTANSGTDYLDRLIPGENPGEFYGVTSNFTVPRISKWSYFDGVLQSDTGNKTYGNCAYNIGAVYLSKGVYAISHASGLYFGKYVEPINSFLGFVTANTLTGVDAPVVTYYSKSDTFAGLSAAEEYTIDEDGNILVGSSTTTNVGLALDATTLLVYRPQ